MVFDIAHIDDLLAQRKYADALSACISIVDINDSSIELLERKAEAYKGVGDLSSANACLDKIIDSDPFCPAAYFKKSIWMIDYGEYENSIDSLKKTIELDTGYFGEVAYFILAEIFWRNRKYHEAKEALCHVSPDFEIRYMLGYKVRSAADLRDDIESLKC